jgi:predicted nucleic acid-binding Zn ribbon protein
LSLREQYSIGLPILGFGFWITDFRFWILDLPILGFGFWITDFRFWILDYRF